MKKKILTKIMVNKLKTKKAPPKPTIINNEENVNLQSEELQQQFELELCWCIQQFQVALKSDKLNQKQVQDHTKSLNALMCNTTPVIRKRQIMRMSFGNYREKMAEEEGKHKRNNLQVKVQSMKPNQKSLFLRKAGENQAFTFNFPIDNNEELNSELKEENTAFKFVPSSDSFKFNFTVGEQV